MTAAEKISKARTLMVLDAPFWGSLAVRLHPVEDSNIETACTNGKQIRYNPAFIDGMPIDEVKTLLAHEVMHCTNGHQSRQGAREHEKWNMAADMAINPILQAAGFAPIKGWLSNGAPDKSAEEIYATMPPTPPGSGGKDGNGPGGVEPAGQSESDRAQSKEEWKIATQQAAKTAKAMGKLPAGMEQWITEMLAPIVDWKDVLRRFISQNAKNDYTWSRPNRRFIHAGLYLPSLLSQELGEIVIAVDNSGSIAEDPEILKQFAAEMNDALSAYPGTRATVLYCDAQIQKVEEYAEGDTIVLRAPGGGGTDFRPVFDWITEQGRNPVCMVYLTDGQGDYPETPPTYPVLWGTTDEEAPWGEIVKIRRNE